MVWLEGFVRVLWSVLGTDDTYLTQVCNLAVDSWPEDRTVSMLNGELRATMNM